MPFPPSTSADFGDFNRYESEEFLQKFVLFPIVSKQSKTRGTLAFCLAVKMFVFLCSM